MKSISNFSTPSRTRVRLTTLLPGQRARVSAPDPGNVIPARLLELGFVPGTSLEIVRRAPLGDPVEIELRGYRLCLHVRQLDSLSVERE